MFLPRDSVTLTESEAELETQEVRPSIRRGAVRVSQLAQLRQRERPFGQKRWRVPRRTPMPNDATHRACFTGGWVVGVLDLNPAFPTLQPLLTSRSARRTLAQNAFPPSGEAS